MKTVADKIDLRLAPHAIPVDSPQGELGFAITSNPWRDQFIHPLCYVILASWLPADSPAGMFITVRPYKPAGETDNALEVGSVYASDVFRGCDINGEETLAVRVGQWLIEEEALTHHSPDRTDSGDRWAKAIGGRIPLRDQMGTDKAILKTGAQALARLNSETWTPSPWPEWPPPPDE